MKCLADVRRTMVIPFLDCSKAFLTACPVASPHNNPAWVGGWTRWHAKVPFNLSNSVSVKSKDWWRTGLRHSIKHLLGWHLIWIKLKSQLSEKCCIDHTHTHTHKSEIKYNLSLKNLPYISLNLKNFIWQYNFCAKRAHFSEFFFFFIAYLEVCALKTLQESNWIHCLLRTV